MWKEGVAGREPEEEFACSACSELWPEEVRITGLGLCGGAELSGLLLVLLMLRPFNPFLALWRGCYLLPSRAPILPGTEDLGLAFRPMEESMDVVPAFAFPELGGGGVALGDSTKI